LIGWLRARLRGPDRTPPPPRVQGTNLHGFDAVLVDRAVARLRRFPPWADADYRALHPDVAQSDFDPAVHAIGFGAFEARRFFADEKLRERIETPAPRREPSHDAAASLSQIGIYVGTHGNVFMRDIARDIAHDLAACGAAVRLGDETSPPDAPDGTRIIVAPHEFFTQGAGRAWMRDDIIRNAVLFGTEQVQTAWFAQSLPFLLMARAAIDMSPRTAAMLRQTGLPATDYLPSTLRPAEPLGAEDRAHPLLRSLPSDIAFLGTDGPRRRAFFARHAGALDGFTSTIFLRDPSAGPMHDAALTRLAAHIAAQTSIWLNIHQDEFGFFEWHRIVRLGMANASLVVSEPSERQRDFHPGTHYLEAEADRIPALLDWLLRSPDGQAEAQRIRANATALVTDETAARRNAQRLCAFLADPGLGARDNPV
jgi:hypothetical protein